MRKRARATMPVIVRALDALFSIHSGVEARVLERFPCSPQRLVDISAEHFTYTSFLLDSCMF